MRRTGVRADFPFRIYYSARGYLSPLATIGKSQRFSSVQNLPDF
jgi:hypothetical protein